jgi:hypothetical protein
MPVVLASLIAAALLGAVVALIAARTSSDRNTTAARPPSVFAPSPGAGTGPGVQADPDARVLTQLVVQPGDVGLGQTVGLLRGGNRVVGQPTLDLCNGTFPSEALRAARLQVAEVDGGGTSVLSTEAVLYQSGAATTQAFAELQKVAAQCPSTPVVSPQGEPTIQTKFAPAPDAAWPQTATVQRLAYDFVTTDDTGQTQHSIAVYLHRGRAFIGVYFPHPDGSQPPVQSKTSIPDIVSVFASRLAALPDAVVNRSGSAPSLS